MKGHVVAIVVLISLATTASGQAIDRQVLDQAKDAVVFVKLKAGRLQGSGSGFVIKTTGDSVLVMTNRHVAAPEASELPDGAKVELTVVFRSGTPQQQELPAVVLAYDEREVRDLAVIEVRNVRMPPRPILADQTSAESEFIETMPVYALGFPLGSRIQEVVDNRVSNPAITVTQMSISSLRRDEADHLARVQLTGSLIEGNSGGPIIDARGRLVGVAVSRLRGESVGFAVPPSVIASFLGGDIGGITAELLAAQGGNAQVKLSVRVVDPLGKLKSVAVRYARYPNGPWSPKPDAGGGWPLLSGGTSVALSLAGAAANGQVRLPVATPADRKLLVQFVLTDTSGRVSASKPTTVNLPDRPGMIAGLAEAKPRVLVKWSCEVNVAEGAKISNQPGSTTIDIPGGIPMVNAPQFKLFNPPCALVQVDGDFLATVKVTNEFDPGGEVVSLPGGKKLPFTFQGAGLLIWQDEKNFVRIERCKGSDGEIGLIHRVLVEVYKGGREIGVHYTKALPEQPMVLGAKRKGSTVQLLFADAPDSMHVFQELALDFAKEVFVGISASNLSKLPLQAKFEGFSVKRLDDGQDIEAKPVAMSRLIDTGSEHRPDGTWVFEGAVLKVLQAVGGPAAPQANMDQFKGQWSNNRQLLWRATKMGDGLSVEIPIETAGNFEIKGQFTLGPEYAKLKFTLDGKPLNQSKPIDFYDKDVQPTPLMSLGTLSLVKGKHKFTAIIAGKNASSGGFCFGIDELQVVPAAKEPARPKSKS